MKSAAKQKVPSKSNYNKTGGGKKQDEEYVDQADEQLLDILGNTAIHDHDTVDESTSLVSLLTDNFIPASTLEKNHIINSIEEIQIDMPAEDDNNLELHSICINSTSCDEQNSEKKEM